VNAPRWLTLTTSLLLATNLVGCASFSLFGSSEKPIEIITKAADKTPLDIPLSDPLKLKPIEWVLVTPANQDEVFKKLDEKGNDPVVFALTADGYQQLAVTIAELRNLINTQRNIIIKYKEYYEPNIEKTKDKK
jgi:hypothetical protein